MCARSSRAPRSLSLPAAAVRSVSWTPSSAAPPPALRGTPLKCTAHASTRSPSPPAPLPLNSSAALFSPVSLCSSLPLARHLLCVNLCSVTVCNRCATGLSSAFFSAPDIFLLTSCQPRTATANGFRLYGCPILPALTQEGSVLREGWGFSFSALCRCFSLITALLSPFSTSHSPLLRVIPNPVAAFDERR